MVIFSHLIFALTFLTRIPCFIFVQLGNPSASIWAFPVVGAVIGGIIAGVFYALSLLLGGGTPPPLLLAWVLVALGALLTGALHEDGLADMLDGLFAGDTIQRRIEIMRDSKIGTYGILGLVIIKSLEAYSIALIIQGPILFLLCAFIFSHAFSRALFAPAIWVLPMPPPVENMAGKGLAKNFKKPPFFIVLLNFIVIAFIFLLLATIFPPFIIYGFYSIMTGTIIFFLWMAWVYYKIRGYTGDCLGGLQQLGHIGVLFIFASMLGNI